MSTRQRKRHTPEQVVRKLQEADRLLAEGVHGPEAARQLGIRSRPTTAGGINFVGSRRMM